jgi:S1-C subfamily serine protease
MRRLVAAVILSALTLSTPYAAGPWTLVSRTLEESIVFLVGATVRCTGFVIDATRGYILTAAHCDGDKITADGMTTYKLYKDERKDLMVLRSPAAADRPALKLADKNPERGDEIAAMGYGYALEQPMFRVSVVSHPALEIEELSGPFVAINIPFVGGQSGGPVVNLAGEVVMIVQRSAPEFGIGIGAEAIRDKVGRYFAK